MKYHINGNYVSGPCGASVPESCPFWGKFGGPNHYLTEAEAQVAAEELANKLHPLRSSQRSKPSPQFIRTRDAIKAALVTYGGQEPDRLPQVNSTDDMVRQWFGGDRNRYAKFRETIARDGLSEGTKRSVATFITSGVTVDTAARVGEIPLDGAPDSTISSVTLLDNDGDHVDMESLRAGQLTAFTTRDH